MIRQWFINGNNAMTRRRHVHLRPEQLLLLLPHCMQWNECKENVKEDVHNCRQCGRCPVARMRDLVEKYQVRCLVAGGGRLAVAAARQQGIKAIIAVACEKELIAGILATLPKPVLAVTNTRPCGDCFNTSVDPLQVEEAIRSMLDLPNNTANSR